MLDILTVRNFRGVCGLGLFAFCGRALIETNPNHPSVTIRANAVATTRLIVSILEQIFFCRTEGVRQAKWRGEGGLDRDLLGPLLWSVGKRGIKDFGGRSEDWRWMIEGRVCAN